MTTKREIALARLEAAIDKRIDAVENHVAESIDFYKNEADAETVKLAKRVYALEKAIQNQDDTIQNEDAFEVGDRVRVSKRQNENTNAYDFNATGVVTAVDREDTAYPYLVDCGDDGDFRCTADELRTVSPPFPATGNTPVAETFKVGDRIVVAHAAYKKYAGRMGCVSSVGHTAQGVVQYSVDFDGEDCTVYFFPADELRHADSDVKQDAVDVNSAPTFKVGDNVAATSANIPGTVALVVHNGAWIDHHYGGLRKFYPYDQLRHADALDVDVTAYAGVIHTNSHGDQFHVIPRGDFLEAEHWRKAFNVEERESLDVRQALDKANARAVELERALGGVTGCYCAAIDRAVEAEAKLADETHRADENERIWRAQADELERARSSQRIDPARAGLSRMSPFTYYPSSAEPAGVTRVTDSYGDVWVRDADGSWSGDVGAIHEGYQDSWDDVLDQYGPLTEVQK